jgi:L-erythro-3,5-diaminohexanoate dehydrogenase
VLEPIGSLPQAALKINNTEEIWENEILLDVDVLNITSSAFNRIKSEANGDVQRIKDIIIDIVEKQGKFQDLVTKSGGMLIGRVRKIGSGFENKIDLKIGDKIATLVSLSLTPLKIKTIKKVNIYKDQIYVEGHAVLFESGIYTKLPADLPEALSLALMDVAGAPGRVAKTAVLGQTVIVIGGGKAGILCLHEAKKRVSPTGKVICVEHSKGQCELIEEFGVADYVIHADATKPLEVLYKVGEVTNGELADITVNCVNVPEIEMASILVHFDFVMGVPGGISGDPFNLIHRFYFLDKLV